jgi:hypothetical protein
MWWWRGALVTFTSCVGVVNYRLGRMVQVLTREIIYYSCQVLIFVFRLFWPNGVQTKLRFEDRVAIIAPENSMIRHYNSKLANVVCTTHIRPINGLDRVFSSGFFLLQAFKTVWIYLSRHHPKLIGNNRTRFNFAQRVNNNPLPSWLQHQTRTSLLASNLNSKTDFARSTGLAQRDQCLVALVARNARANRNVLGNTQATTPTLSIVIFLFLSIRIRRPRNLWPIAPQGAPTAVVSRNSHWDPATCASSGLYQK